MALLELKNVHARYGESAVLHGVTMEIRSGEVVSMLGRNGMGKSTTVRTIMGAMQPTSGEVVFKGDSNQGRPLSLVAHSGIGWVPEGRRIFANLTVEENLLVAQRPARDGSDWTAARVYGLFPRLEERRRNLGNQLSGGEQQMLAISRALMLKPKLLLLDEPSFGLAPLIVAEIFRIMRQINVEDGVSMLLVEQNASLALNLAHHAYLLETGTVALSGPAEQIKNDESVRRAYLGY
jgi:branched-chain amino acid transport system ATP-binding protein